MMSADFRKALHVRRRRLVETVRAVGASLILTMRLLQDLPPRDVRPDIAIVREWTRGGRFDPRECLSNGVVLTLPFLPETAEHWPRRWIEIGPN